MTPHDCCEKLYCNSKKRTVYVTIVTVAVCTIFLTYFTTNIQISILPVTRLTEQNAEHNQLSSNSLPSRKQSWIIRKVHITQHAIGSAEEPNQIIGDELDVIDDEFWKIGNLRSNITDQILTFHSDSILRDSSEEVPKSEPEKHIPSDPLGNPSRPTHIQTQKQTDDYMYDSQFLFQSETLNETEIESGTTIDNVISYPRDTKADIKRNVTSIRAGISYRPEEVNIMMLKPYQFSSEYKNPCWIEDSRRQYESYYMGRNDVRRVLSLVDAILRGRQQQGDYHKVRCLPYFFMIGQPKSGSTDLYQKLIAHPEVASIPPKFKEPHWWARLRLGRHGAKGNIFSVDSYIDLFDYAAYNIEMHNTVSPKTGRIQHNMITGEGSMSTFWDNDHWQNLVGNENASEPKLLNPDYIHHLLPQSKLILILRNPSTRMYSDYLYFAKGKKFREDFHEAVVNAARVYDNCQKRFTLRKCVYNGNVNRLAKIRFRVGMYATFLSDWFRVFPRNQFFIVRTEDYAADARGVLRRLHSFLSLRPLSVDEEDRIVSQKKANTRRLKDRELGDMLPETRVLLDRVYKPHNEQLARLLGDNRFLWRDVRGIS